MRRAFGGVAAALIAAWAGWSGPVAAQQDQTLADIRQELSVLFVEIQRLKRELSTTSGPAIAVGGDTLQRVDQIEAGLQQLTAKAEELEFRIGRVVEDGTNRVGDLEFRLCELEADCDIATLGDTPRLGGVEAPVTAVVTPPRETDQTQFAVGEQADFDAARDALEQADYALARELFETFTATYPGSPLSPEAHFLRGQALEQLEATSAAARAYLESFSSAPNGPRAPVSLLRLGAALADLGQVNEACVTLGEVGARFPGAAEVAAAETERRRLGCS